MEYTAEENKDQNISDTDYRIVCEENVRMREALGALLYIIETDGKIMKRKPLFREMRKSIRCALRDVSSAEV